MLSGGIAMYLLYDTAVEEQRARLRDTVRSQARLIEAVARHEIGLGQVGSSDPMDNILSQVLDAHRDSQGFGKTGELVLAKRHEDQIVFVLSKPHGNDTTTTEPMPFAGEKATPMRRALMGGSGTIIGTDYRGHRVLAAYERLDALDMGLVAKIDMAELREPFIAAALRGGLVALLAIVVSASLFLRATRPLIRRVEETDAYNRSLVDAAADGIIALDADRRVTSFNPAAERIFGHPSKNAIGMPIHDLIPQATPDREQRTVNGAHSDGTTIPLEIAESDLETPDGFRQLLIVRDVSARKRLEEELRHSHKMRAVGTLASGIAHDFNNLLMGITGCADMALHQCGSDEPARVFLNEIKSSAIGGASITRQLLAFGRRTDAAPAVNDLNTIVAGVEQMLRRTLGANIDLRVLCAPAPLHIRGDQGQLEQILLNLVVNARHAMPNGGTLDIETSAVSRDSDLLALLTVTDTGVGMCEETRARIFEPFFTTKPPGEGTGLGLSSTYAIVEQNGGHIVVESTPGVGTTFRVFWPRIEASQGVAAQQELDAERWRGDETILVVEDEPRVTMTIQHYLEPAGYTVLTAPDAKLALETVRGRGSDIDLLLTDITLPNVSGPELAATIRGLLPGIRVLFVSAYSTVELVRDGRLEPGLQSLQKPFTEAVLLERIREVLDASVPAFTASPAGDATTHESAATVLLVEDHVPTREASCELLDSLGYNVLPAADGAEALSLGHAHSATIDIVVTDMGLPDMPCGAMLSSLREVLGPRAAVLLVSGCDSRDPALLQLLEQPRTAFVEKPVDFDALAATMQRLLDRQRLPAA